MNLPSFSGAWRYRTTRYTTIGGTIEHFLSSDPRRWSFEVLSIVGSVWLGPQPMADQLANNVGFPLLGQNTRNFDYRTYGAVVGFDWFLFDNIGGDQLMIFEALIQE